MPGIVVGIDGSVHSRHALEWAMSEAALRGTPLTVLTVAQITTAYWGPAAVWYPPPDTDVAEQALKVAHEEVDAVLDKLGTGSPPSVSVKAVVGLPAEEILRAARDADMIVVGSRGAGGFRKLLMGSVSLQVTHHARCPVVVIPAEDGAAFISRLAARGPRGRRDRAFELRRFALFSSQRPGASGPLMDKLRILHG